MQGPLNADRRLAGIALEERKGLIIVGNKWDLVREQGEYSQGELIKEIHALVPFASFAPVIFLSALTKRKLGGLMPLIMKVAANLDRRIPTAKLNTPVRDAVVAHPPPLAAGYCAQVAAHPPLFVFHCNDPDGFGSSYKRFLENVLRSNYDFEGVPLTFEFRERSRVELAT
jgi:GTP-binding protein